MSDQTQPVVDASQASAQPDAAAESARTTEADDLDKVLAEYDAAARAASAYTQPAAATAPVDDLKYLTETMKGLIGTQQQQQFRSDMQTTIKDVRGNLDATFFDDGFVESWIDAQARSDPRLAVAWTNRHVNPRQFQRVVDTLGKSFAKKYGKLPDKGATEDREAVAAAVRGASTKAPEGKAPEYAGMSNAQYRETIRKDYGFDPGV